jgi:hypothetical protein
MLADQLTYDDAIALSDAELEERLYRCIDEIDDDGIYARLSVLIDELTERHAPHIARMSLGACTPTRISTRISKRCGNARARG